MNKFKFLALFLAVFLVTKPSFGEESGNLILGAAQKDTPYYEFGLILKEYLNKETKGKLKITVKESSGSIENLKSIGAGKVDLALAQNDIAHYFYYGKKRFPVNKDFESIYPLYLEHVWIISKNDLTIETALDFKNRVISMGDISSGTRQNALDVLSEFGLMEKVDYIEKPMSFFKAMKGLIEGELDVVFLTSNSIPMLNKWQEQNLKTHGLSETIINRIIKNNPYYQKSSIPTIGGGSISALSVRAYLVGSKGINKSQVEILIKLIHKLESHFVGEGFSLNPLPETIGYKPIPFNNHAKEVFEQLGYIKRENKGYLFFIIVISIVVVVLYSSRKIKTYDRSGKIITANSLTHRIICFAAKGDAFIFTILIFATILWVDVMVIQYFEAEHVKYENIQSVFADLSIFKGTVAMFLYMASGYTSDSFPVSDIGRILAALLPMVGVATLGAIFFIFLEKNRAISERNKKGLSKIVLRNHVLICGWNEVCPTLIYNLTSSESPERKFVVIVANLKTEKPVEFYGFDDKYVHYCKGASTNPEVLARASADYAESAIIVADTDNKESKNTLGLITTMIIRSYFKNTESSGNIFIASELRSQENKNYFKAAKSDAIIDSLLIRNGLPALACLSPGFIAFLFNAFNFDEKAEIYSMQASLLPSFIGETVLALMSHLGRNNINLIGVGSVQSGCDIDLLIKEDSFERLIAEDDMLFYSANNATDLSGIQESFRDLNNNEPLPFKHINIFDNNALKNILLVGSLERCMEVREFLISFSSEIKNICILTDELEINNEAEFIIQGNLGDPASWDAAHIDKADRILVIFDDDTSANSIDYSLEDSKTIIVTNFVRNMLDEMDDDNKIRAVVISEMKNTINKDLFLNAGVDIPIPIKDLIALMLSKTVYSKGLICDFIISLIRNDSGVCFREIVVQVDDGFCGNTFTDLISCPSIGFNILGWVPRSDHASIENSYNDPIFLIPTDSRSNRAIRAGDVIVGITKR